MTESKILYRNRCFLETLLNYQAELRKTRLMYDGFEVATHLDEISDAAAATNEGLKAREFKFNNSKGVRLIGRLHLFLWHQ